MTCAMANKGLYGMLKQVGAAIFSLTLFLAGGARAAEALSLQFVTHAAFFSAETKQPVVIDPQAFVADAAQAAAVGPQGIKHVAGFRPAKIAHDGGATPVFTADGRPLGFDLGAWLGATGSVTIAQTNGAPVLTAMFSGLRPGGVYSLFENHFDQKPVGFAPMDGAGKANTFAAGADGAAKVTIQLDRMPTHANAVLLVYHSDGVPHRLERGRIGVDAHHQLIARPN